MRVVTADFVLRWCQKTKQGQEKPRAVATVIRPCDICNSCDIAHDLDVEYERVQEGTETVAQIVPQRMRFRDVSAGVDTLVRALEHDPLQHYLKDTPDKRNTRVWRTAQRLQVYLAEVRLVAQKKSWMINRGESVMARHRAANDPIGRPSPGDKVIDVAADFLSHLLRRFNSKEQEKRMEEWAFWMHKALGSTIADKLDDMLLISALATAPECQGKGYASTLVRMATSLADAQGRAVWLGSSNLKNLEFYNSLGFYTVYRISLGLNNPTWTEPPVLVDLMVREPHGLKPS